MTASAIGIRSTITVLILSAGLLPERGAAAEHDVPAIVTKWLKSSQNAKSVQARYTAHRYNRVFLTCRISVGDFFFESSDKAFIRNRPERTTENRESVVRSGVRYSVKGGPHETIIWRRDDIAVTDERYKTYETLRGKIDFLGLSVDFQHMIPFVPGHATANDVDEWDFSAVTEDDQDFRVVARRREDRRFGFTQCELLIAKSDLRLRAVRCLDADNQHETVFVFDDVVLNPDVIPQIDLSEYRSEDLAN